MCVCVWVEGVGECVWYNGHHYIDVNVHVMLSQEHYKSIVHFYFKGNLPFIHTVQYT